MRGSRSAPALAAAAMGVLLAVSPSHGEEANTRWDFLPTNLQVFPGTEKIFEPDADLFWRLKANLTKVQAAEKLPERAYPFVVSTDAEGRRRTGESPEGAATVIFLGDSCTFGIPVNDGEAFPARVGKLLGIRAINAGVPGYSAFQGRAVLDKWATGPMAVVITFWLNGRTSWDHLSDAEHLELLAAERAGEMSRHRVTRLLRRVTPGTRPRLSEGEFAGELRKMIARARGMGAAPLLAVVAAPPGYVEPAACRPCHQEFYDRYLETPIGRSFYLPADGVASADWNQATFYHEASERYGARDRRRD